MEHSWMLKHFAEFFGTLILVLFGNGSAVNSFLKGTAGNAPDGKANGDWILAAFSFGFGVTFPAILFGLISDNHINPAVTVAQAAAGNFPWSQVAPHITYQLLSATCGQPLVLTVYWPHFKESIDPDIVFSCFATSDCTNSKWNGFISEVVGTAVLMFVAIGPYKGMFFKQAVDIANIGVGFLITALVMALGGPTGSTLNPVRDFGPRLVYPLLPIPNKKGGTHWSYGWIPVIAPTLGAIIGIFLYKIPFGS